MPKTIVLICALFLFFHDASAQSFDVSGTVTDSTQLAVPFASIALSSTKDTSVVQFTIAKEDGSFLLKNIESGNYFLVVACVGYEVLHFPIEVISNKLDIRLMLPSSAMSLKEVLVLAKGIPMLMNGDTVVYNSNSFKTQSNASVEDLIKKMPGIQVNKDGSVAAEGQSITKILINGKEFFGGNVQAATKNLDASLVDKVEVIDKKSDDDQFSGQ
jgi:CarboxypepD_reg-like domain